MTGNFFMNNTMTREVSNRNTINFFKSEAKL